MASILKGSIAFGLVNIPIELKSAVRSEHISFRLLHQEDLSPIKYERICLADDQPVPWEEIVKGYEYEKGKFVVMTDADFEAAAVENSKTIDILDFVKQEEIDPRFFETPYYLLPTKGGEKPYALLREAIRNTESVGIGKIILRQTQHLAAIKVVGDALILEMMRFANELVDIDEYHFPDVKDVRPQEIKMAEQLIGNLADTFDPEKYKDEYRDNLMRIIEGKMKGKKVKLKGREAVTTDGKVIDLMARLQESLKAGAKRSPSRGRKKAATSRRATKTGRKKSA